MSRTGCPLIPPLALTYADHARSAGGAGPDTAPRMPDSAPKEPRSISDLGPPAAGAGVARPPGVPATSPPGVPAAPLPPVTAPEPRELPEVAAPPEPDPAEPALRAAPAEPELALPATAVPPDEDADAPPPPATDPAAPFPAATWPAPALAAPFPAVVVSVPSADPADGPAATPCVSTACLKTLFVASNRACPSREPHAVSERASAAP